MPKYKWPFLNCTYETDEVADELATVLLSVHPAGTQTTQAVAAAPNFATTPKIDERVRPPTVSAAGPSEEWSYFLTRWQDYVEATSKIKSCNYLNVVTSNYAKTSHKKCCGFTYQQKPWDSRLPYQNQKQYDFFHD